MMGKSADIKSNNKKESNENLKIPIDETLLSTIFGAYIEKIVWGTLSDRLVFTETHTMKIPNPMNKWSLFHSFDKALHQISGKPERSTSNLVTFRCVLQYSPVSNCRGAQLPNFQFFSTYFNLLATPQFTEILKIFYPSQLLFSTLPI